MGEVIAGILCVPVLAFVIPVAWRIGAMVGRRLADRWEWRLIGAEEETSRMAFVRSPQTELKQILTEPQSQAQDERKPRPLSSAEARLRVNQRNAEFFSADRHRPNSEIVKENSSNG